MRLTLALLVASTALAVVAPVAAAETVRLTDLEPREANSSPGDLTAVGDELFFSAASPATGRELFASDGTRRGTRLVKDIDPGPSGVSFRAQSVELAGQLLFRVRCITTYDPGVEDSEVCGDPPRELWRSDGTTGGTAPIDVPVAPIGGLASLAGHVFFYESVPYGAPGYPEKLWSSDGTQAGTNELLGGQSRSLYYAVDGAELGGIALLGAHDDAHGFELWRSDGTPAGTSLVADIAPGPGNSEPLDLTAFNGSVYFLPRIGFSLSQLWRSDGTDAGTQLVYDFGPGAIVNFLVAGADWMYVGVTVGDEETTLWRTDGTAAGTQPVREMPPRAFSFSSRAEPPVVGNRLFFEAYSYPAGARLWTSDGSGNGTHVVRSRGGRADDYAEIVPVGGRVYFDGIDDRHGEELWSSDAKGRRAKRVRDLRQGRKGSNPEALTAVGGRLFFSADTGARGRELWVARP